MDATMHELTRYRKVNDLTLKDISDEVEANVPTLSKIERRAHYPSAKLLAQLVRVTGLKAEAFLPPLPKNWKKRCG